MDLIQCGQRICADETFRTQIPFDKTKVCNDPCPNLFTKILEHYASCLHGAMGRQ